MLDALGRGSRHGFDILDATGLPSGTVYPILRRLEQDGLARSRWESAQVAQSEQRPPRRYYELTRDGLNAWDGRAPASRSSGRSPPARGPGAPERNAR